MSDTQPQTPQKISKTEWQIFGNKYALGKFPHERFGQAFINRCLPSVIDSELFRETNKSKARTIIMEKYVDFSK